MADPETEPWVPHSEGKLGRAHLRLEDRALVTGGGHYVSDLIGDDCLHAHFVRSTVAHGFLKAVETENALGWPGVVSVVTAETIDLPDLPPPHGLDRPDVTRPLLARDRVRYVGEPVAMIVAESAAMAADGAEHVWLELEDLPVALAKDPEGAVAGPRLFQDSNVLKLETTPARATIQTQLPISVSVEIHNQRIAAMPIEGLAILCEPTGHGRLKVTCGHQSPHTLRSQLAATIGIDEKALQVVVPDVGGAFGLKGMYFTEYPVVAATALTLGRPVAWIEDRREHLSAGMHGRDQIHRVTLEGETSGRLRRARIEIIADVGAYPQSGAIIPALSRFVATGLYDFEEVAVEMTLVATNRAPTGSYRGAGRPEAAYAIERAIDAFALDVGLAPEEVRRLNFIAPSQLPYLTATGALHDSGHYAGALEKALELVNIDSVRLDQKTRLANGANPIGLGIGAYIERTGGPADSGEFGDVELDRSGSLIVRTGSTDAGQGHQTVWSQAIAEVFDVDFRWVEFRSGDTDEVRNGTGTYASRSAQVGASAAFRMAVKVRETARDIAATMLEVSPLDLVIHQGAFHVAGVPDAAVTLVEVAARAHEAGTTIREEEVFAPGSQAFPYGVHVAVVEVDIETGVVSVLRLVTVDDCGNVLNPMIVEGQLHGSLVQGSGQALSEAVVYNSDGVPLAATMMDYLIPAATNGTQVTTGRLYTPAPNNPLGVKGTGEAGCIGAPPAIVNATLDALRPYGVKDLQMPLTPARVWEALRTL
ncbi:MAG: xanthine dehydrogenase family protein molybdopterin-binding subunit [Acidimicrobiia bacterium]